MNRCDFCNAPNPTHELHLKPVTQVAVREDDGSTISHELDPEWAACDDCFVLLEAGNRDALIDRAMNAGDFDPKLRPVIENLYSVLFGDHAIVATVINPKPDDE